MFQEIQSLIARLRASTMTEAVVRCVGRRCGGRTVKSSDTTRRPPIVSDDLHPKKNPGEGDRAGVQGAGESRMGGEYPVAL